MSAMNMKARNIVVVPACPVMWNQVEGVGSAVVTTPVGAEGILARADAILVGVPIVDA